MSSVRRLDWITQRHLFWVGTLVMATTWGCAPRVEEPPPGKVTEPAASVTQPAASVTQPAASITQPPASVTAPAASVTVPPTAISVPPIVPAPEPLEIPAEVVEESKVDPDAAVEPEVVEEEMIEQEAPAEDAVSEPGEQQPVEDEASEKEPAEAEPAADEQAASDAIDLTEIITVKWLPEPTDVPEAKAETAEQMKPYTEKLSGSDVTFEMVPIPSGRFVMGSPETEEGREEDEGPQVEVEVEPFWMGKHEVTWDEYEQWAMELDKKLRAERKAEPTSYDLLADALTQPTPPYTDMSFGMGKKGYPAICMTPLSARLYCKWLSAKTGRYYRLPTEAEWEYACRAGTKTAYCFGDDPEKLDEYGWYFDNSDDSYHKVGEKKPNAWGLYDMHGNVSEWVLDQYAPDSYAKSEGKTLRNPLVPVTTEYPVVARGGCWDEDPEHLRSAARAASEPNWKMQDPQIPQSIWYTTEVYCPGFRVVRPLRVPDEEQAKLYEPDIDMIREYKKASAGKY